MIYDLPTVEQDNTFEEMSFLFPFPLTGLTIELKFYYPNSRTSFASYTLGNNLEIDANESKRLKIKSHIVTIEPGSYYYKLKLNPDDIRTTYLNGNWTIT